MSFIPADKMKVLREAAAKGDERARKIINAHFKKQDYSKDLEDYFKPVSAPVTPEAPEMPAVEPGPMPENVSTGNPKLDEFLRGNGIKQGDPDYEDALNDYYNEFPNERPTTGEGTGKPVTTPVHDHVPQNIDVQEEVDMTKEIVSGIIDLIGICDRTSLAIMQNDDIDDTIRKGAMTSIQEIKQTLLDSADKVKKIKQSLCKKDEEVIQ